MDALKTGEFIRELRKEKDLTQQQFAELIHVSDKAVSRWETGRGFPDIGNIEDIAETCGISVAELLRGERLKEQVTPEDVREVSDASFNVAREFVRKKSLLNIVAGFLAGALILLLVSVHLMSPIPIQNSDDHVSVDVLSSGEIVAVMNGNVAGFDLNLLKDPDSGRNCAFISAYDTIWHHIIGGDEKLLVSVGAKDDIDYVYYYPGDFADQLIWKNDNAPEPDFNVRTMPRLVYNYWIVIGAVVSFIGLVICFILRKKYYFGRVLKAVMVPVALTISLVAVLAGKYNTVYSAPYYLSGILLMAILIYVLFIILQSMYAQKRKI